MYACVKNGQIVGVSYTLPTSYKNISGFNNLSVEEKISHGYYSMEEVKPSLATVNIGDEDNPAIVCTQYYSGHSDDIQVDKIVRTYTVSDKSPEVVNQELELLFTKSLENHYDNKAKVKRYDNRFTCALRAGYTSVFQSEGIEFAQWMDSCNAYAYGVMAEVKAGNRAMPTISDLIGELPVLNWQ